MLKGTLVPTKLDLSNETSYYYLGRVNGNVGFYKFKSADGFTTITLGANKAYMDTSVPTINHHWLQFLQAMVGTPFE